MHTAPTHRPAQTIAQAKASYKKHGPRISSQEARQLKRGAELYKRAEKIKEKERRRKVAAQKKQEKELREREGRRKSGQPTQVLPKVSQRQVLLFDYLGKAEGGCGNGESGDGEARWVAPAQEEERRDLQEEDNEVLKSATHDLAMNDTATGTDDWDNEVDDNSLLETLAPVPAPVSTSELMARTFFTSSSFSNGGSICSRSASEPPYDMSQSVDAVLNDLFDDESFASSTQIQRDIAPAQVPALLPTTVEVHEPRPRKYNRRLSPPAEMSFLSTQDVSFDAEDEKELGFGSVTHKQEPERQCPKRDTNAMPPPARLAPRADSVQKPLSWPYRKPTKPTPPKTDVLSKQLDRISMPPPPRPRPPSKTPAALPHVYQQSLPAPYELVADLYDLETTDFELSTQDCREIEV